MTFGNIHPGWSDDIEILIDRLESESQERELTREERAIIDVVESIQLITEGDGLHDFWQSSGDKQRVINSFDLVGSSAMVDLLNSSQWCETRTADRDQYTEAETNYLSEIEEELPSALEELNDLIEEFMEGELEE